MTIIWGLLVILLISLTSFSFQSLVFKPIPIEVSSTSTELFLRTSSSSSVYISTNDKNIIFDTTMVIQEIIMEILAHQRGTDIPS